jgi:hypothetical protein
MIEIIGTLKDANIPTVLAIAGIILILLAIGVEGGLKIPQQRQKAAGITGVLMLVASIVMSIIPTTHDQGGKGTEIASTVIIPSVNFLSNDKLYTSNGADFQFKGRDNLNISSAWYGRVWLDQELPRNFRMTLNIQTIDNLSEVIVGIGDGKSEPEPALLFTLTSRGAGFAKRVVSLPGAEPQTWLRDNSDDALRPGMNKQYNVVFERNNDVIRILLNNELIFAPIRDEDLTNKLNYFLFASNQQGNQSGTIVIRDIILEEIN